MQEWPDVKLSKLLDSGCEVTEDFWQQWNGSSTAGSIIETFLKKSRPVPEEFWQQWDGISDWSDIAAAYTSRNLPLPKSYLLIRKQIGMLKPEAAAAYLKFVSDDVSAEGFGEEVY